MAVKSTVNPKFSSLSSLVDDIALHGIPADAVDIYQGRNRVVKYNHDGLMVNIKQFKVPNAVNRLVYGHLRHSKARRSYENALKLLKMGLSTPQPIAWIEISEEGRLGVSYYICVQEEGMSDVRCIDLHPRRYDIADGIGHMISRLHSRHVFMKDFSQGNILWRVRPSGRIEFTLVDINRMSFGVRLKRRLMKNFRTIADDPVLLRDIAAAYSRYACTNPDQTLAQVIKVRKAYLRRRKLKKLFK